MKRNQGTAIRLCLVSIFVLVLSLSGLASAKEIKLEFWHGITASDYEGIKDMVQQFNEEYAGEIYVEEIQMDWHQLYDKSQIAVASGVAADVALIHKDRISERSELGLLRPLDDLWEEAGWDEDSFLPGVADGAKWKGIYYGVPLDIYVHALFYNADHLAEAGITGPPTNPEEYKAQAKKLTKIDNEGKTERWGTHMPHSLAYFYNTLWQHGGRIYADDDRTVTLNTPEVRSAMQFVSDMVFVDQVSPVFYNPPSMWAGQVSLNVSGIWDLKRVQQLREEGSLNLQVAPMDSLYGTEQRGVRVGSHEMVIFNQLREDPERIEAAKTFIKFVSGTQRISWMKNGHLPVTYEAIASPAFASLPDHQKLFNQIYVFVPSPPWGVGEDIMREVLCRAYNPGYKNFNSIDNVLEYWQQQFELRVNDYYNK